jgi:SAM-dependent methyltransferase
MQAIKRVAKQGMLSMPTNFRDSAALRGLFRMREAVNSAVGDWKYRKIEAPDGLSIPPASLRVAVSGIADPMDHLDAGRRSALAIEDILAKNRVEIAQMRSILDFGCGSGRVTRRWKNLTETDIRGCDYNADAIAWCRRNLNFASWAVNRLAPPLPYADGQFELVYGLSVFTHFRSDLQQPWMLEMRRVSSPGGHVIVTTMGESFHSHLSGDEPSDFEAGELVVHFPQSAGSNMCAAYHPEAYMEKLLERAGLSLIEFLPAGKDSLYPQDMWLAQNTLFDAQ